MFKPAICPNCGGKIQIPDNQTAFKCLYCGGEFFSENAQVSAPLPPQSPASPQPPVPLEAHLKISFAGVWVVLDQEVKVLFDNQLVGVDSLKNGFSFVFSTLAGKHVLELRTAFMNKRYDFEIPSGGSYQAQINYSRALGFSSNLNFNQC
jgi:hypothetical protein